MAFCLTVNELEKWSERVLPYVDVIKHYFEQHSLWHILLPGKKQIGTEEPTKYRILNKGSIVDRLGMPLPIFQDTEDENEALFKLFETDHDVELVAENISVAFEYSEKMKEKCWIKAIAPDKKHVSIYNQQCVRLVPMFGENIVDGEISHEAVHSFIRRGLIETFVKDEITDEEEMMAINSNSYKARRKSIPIYSKTGPPTREVSEEIGFERCGPAHNVRVLSRGESKVYPVFSSQHPPKKERKMTSDRHKQTRRTQLAIPSAPIGANKNHFLSI